MNADISKRWNAASRRVRERVEDAALHPRYRAKRFIGLLRISE
jgi:hypothetical protein